MENRIWFFGKGECLRGREMQDRGAEVGQDREEGVASGH